MIFIYTTFPNLKEARRLGRMIIKNRLAACVNFWSIGSIYRWKKKIETTKEAAMIIKTREGNFRRVEKFILENHSYDLPPVIEIDVDMVNEKYARWIAKESFNSR